MALYSPPRIRSNLEVILTVAKISQIPICHTIGHKIDLLKSEKAYHMLLHLSTHGPKSCYPLQIEQLL